MGVCIFAHREAPATCRSPPLGHRALCSLAFCVSGFRARPGCGAGRERAAPREHPLAKPRSPHPNSRRSLGEAGMGGKQQQQTCRMVSASSPWQNVAKARKGSIIFALASGRGEPPQTVVWMGPLSKKVEQKQEISVPETSSCTGGTSASEGAYSPSSALTGSQRWNEAPLKPEGNWRLSKIL